MRKLSGFVILILAALGVGYLVWPEHFGTGWDAGWAKAVSLVQNQLQTEFATLDQIRSGKLKLGAGAEPAARPEPVIILSPEPDQRKAETWIKAQQKSEDRKASSPSNPGKVKLPVSAASTPPLQDISIVAPALPVAAAATVVAAPEKGAPEAALGGILKHEIRENQIKEDTFWTPEHIQEALKHGPPSSSSSACLALCDKNDTPVEINMPKTPAAPP